MILFLEPTKNNLQLFAVDVNGKKAPNKWGQDMFTFAVTATENNLVREQNYITNVGIYPPETCLPGASTADELKDKHTTRSSHQLYKEMNSYQN